MKSQEASRKPADQTLERSEDGMNVQRHTGLQRMSESRHKTYPKTTYIRSRAFLQEVAGLECQNCGATPTQAAHSNWHNKGMGIKASDEMVAALCLRCHYEVDQGKTLTKQQRRDLWEKAHKGTMDKLGKQLPITE